MAEVNVLTKEKIDELRRELWENNERMKECIPKEKQSIYKGYFNCDGIQKVVSNFEKTNVTLRFGASLDFDINEIANAIKNYMSRNHVLDDILQGFLSDSLISDWDFYQKLRKILRRYELQHDSKVVNLKENYRKWIKEKILFDIHENFHPDTMKDAPYSYILCVDDLNKFDRDTPLPSAYLLFKIYSNLIVSYEYCKDETIKEFKDSLEKLLKDEFYFCFFPYRRTFFKNTEKQEKETYSNQTLIDIVDNIFPSCLYSEPLLKLSRKENEDPKELWNKHLIELKTVEDDKLEETLREYGVVLPKRELVNFRKITSTQSDPFDSFFQ